MSIFNELYERTVARLLAEHTERGVPSDLDLWPTIQERITERAKISENEQERARQAASLAPSPLRSQPDVKGLGQKLWRSAIALAGLATFGLLLLITALAISGLANRATRVSQILTQDSLVVSIPFSMTQPSVTAFDIDESGTFWVGTPNSLILRYDSAGNQLDSASLSVPGLIVPYAVDIFDLEVVDGKIWIQDRSSGIFALAITPNSLSSQKYYPALIPLPGDSTTVENRVYTLQKDGDGKIVLARNGDASYVGVTTEQTSTQNITFRGYPAGGKFFTQGSAPNIIMAGALPVKIDLPGNIFGWHILKVLPDKSFYVAVATYGGAIAPVDTYSPNTVYVDYVMHYSADGKLIDRAPVPTSNLDVPDALMKQLAVGPDNSVYALVTPNLLTAYVTPYAEIRRLHFYPASQPMPSTPAPQPTPQLSDITTPVFTIPVGEGIFKSDTRIGGVSVAEDGSLWIHDFNNHLSQFSPAGKLVSTVNMPGPIVCTDFKVTNSNIWVLGRQGDGSNHPPTSVYKLAFDGQQLAKYDLPTNLWAGRSLIIGEAGEILVYSGVYGDESSRINELSQVIDRNGTFSPKPLKGYSSNGKTYTAKWDPNSNPNSGTLGLIQVDGITTQVDVGYRLVDLQVLQVARDSSFYVLADVELEGSGFALPRSNVVLHFDAKGKLIGRAPKSSITSETRFTLMSHIALSPEGLVYALIPHYQDESTNKSLDHVEVLQVNFFADSVPATPVPTVGPPPSLADDTTPVFSISVGGTGIHYITPVSNGTPIPNLGFAAAAPDGTFWFQDGDNQLAHYSIEGKRLGSIPLPSDKGRPATIQLHNNDFWLYYSTPYNSSSPDPQSSPNEADTIYHMAPDGHEIAHYSVPDYIKAHMANIRGLYYQIFLIGEQGEVLLNGNFDNLVTTSPGFPSPVPTEQLPPTGDKPYWKLVDAQGNPAAEPLTGFTSHGREYSVLFPYKNSTTLAYIKAGDAKVVITGTDALFSVGIMQIHNDGSFYVLASEDRDIGGPYISSETTLYHYSTNGKLIERANVPLANSRLLTGAPGEFYATYEVLERTIGNNKEPDRIEIRRLKFYPADQPLPTLPSPISTLLPANPSPTLSNSNYVAPTATVPPLATSTPIPGAEPVSLVRDSDGLRLDVNTGADRFGVGGDNGNSPWIGSSGLAIDWFGPAGQSGSKSYLLDIGNATLKPLPWSTREWIATSRQDGKRIVLTSMTEKPLQINFVDMETGKTETVYSMDTATEQWAGADAHSWTLGTSPLYVYATAKWLDQDNFVLSLRPRFDQSTSDYASKLLLVNTSRHRVRVLAVRGTLADPLPDGALIWQLGGVDGGLQMLAPPYTAQPIQIAPGGPWIRDWAATPDGARVAWIEAMAPPGDWSYTLPRPCTPCGGKDHEPAVQSIAIWGRATGDTQRYPAPKGLVWSFSPTNMWARSGLRWRNDGSALHYATQISSVAGGGAENAGRTTLNEITPDGKSTTLADYNWYGQLETLYEGSDGSIYYFILGEKYVAAGDIVRRHPDGTLEVLYPYIGEMDLALDNAGHLETIKGNIAEIRDLSTGEVRHAAFSKSNPAEFDRGFSTIAPLVPLSPDGKWAAFAGSNSDMIMTSPDGTPDRGRTVSIVQVK